MDLDFSKYSIQWPKTYYKQCDISTGIQKLKEINTIKISELFPSTSPSLIKFILSLCDTFKFNLETKLKSISILEIILQQENHKISKDPLLACIISVLIISKIYETENLSLDIIYNITNHEYTNSTIKENEFFVLKFLDFDFLDSEDLEGLDLLSNCIYWVKSILPINKFAIFAEITEIIFEIVLVKKYKFYYEVFPCLFVVSVIHASFVILTQNFGQFPAVWKLQNFFGIPDEDIFNLSRKILKITLGKRNFKLINV